MGRGKVVGSSLKVRAPVLLIGLFFYWLFEASLDVLLFQKSGWEVAIFSPDFEETWMRCTTMGVLVAFAVVGALLQADRSKEKNLRRRREEEFRSFMETSYDGVWAVDADGTTTYTNPSMSVLLGSRVDQLVGEPAARHLGGSEIWWSDVGGPGHSKPPAGVYNCPILRADGSLVQARISASQLVGEDGLVHGAMAFVTDMTKRKEAEELLRVSLREKEALLKEIHHRVKNNLQVICALLDLQADSIQDPAALKAFQESRERVRSMAILHDRLCSSPSLAQVDFQAYVETLIRSLFTAYGVDPNRVRLAVEAEGIQLEADLAAPCGLIVNELVSNSLKHAFPGGRSGMVQVRFHEEKGQRILAVSDDGVGFAKEADPPGRGTLGLSLVDILARQLGGELHIGGNPGASFKVAFPLPVSAAM